MRLNGPSRPRRDLHLGWKRRDPAVAQVTLRRLAVVASVFVAAVAGSTAHASQAPVAGGDSAANIPLSTPDRIVATRWVAGHTGTLASLLLRVKVEGSDGCGYRGRPGYAAGDSGMLRATTVRVRHDGRPDLGRVLRRTQFAPCGRERGESVDIPLGLRVRKGMEFATLVQNVDPTPGANYFSTNHLYVKAGVVGANGRNERSARARDAVYGLDPREVVGYSTDGGATWDLPGGPYGVRGGRAFLPTYLQRYTDGVVTGQPYYWAEEVTGDVTMTFPRVPLPWTISALGAHASDHSSGTVRLSVNGVERGRVTLRGQGDLRAPIPPVTVPPGATVTVSTVAGAGGLALRRLHADSVWESVMGLGSGFRLYERADPRTAVAVYPLPMYGTPRRRGTS